VGGTNIHSSNINTILKCSRLSQRTNTCSSKGTKMVKQDYAWAMSTLLCLDHKMKADLMNLSEDTLAKMYVQYIQNAKDSNHKLEEAYAHQQNAAPCGCKNPCKARR